MKQGILFILSALFLVMFTTCKKEKSCGAFNINDKAEFSYQNPDTITFLNQDSAVFQVFISEIKLSEAYSFSCRDLYKTCPCINYIEALATNTYINEPYTFLRMEQSDVSEMQYFKYNVKGFEFEFDFINELPYIDQMDHLKYIGSLTIGDDSYNNVIEITNLDLSSANIYKVYFNKGNGVLRFLEKTNSQVWSIQN